MMSDNRKLGSREEGRCPCGKMTKKCVQFFLTGGTSGHIGKHGMCPKCSNTARKPSYSLPSCTWRRFCYRGAKPRAIHAVPSSTWKREESYFPKGLIRFGSRWIMIEAAQPSMMSIPSMLFPAQQLLKPPECLFPQLVDGINDFVGLLEHALGPW